MPKRKNLTTEQDVFIAGGVLSVLGLYVILASQDILAGFVLLGIGIVIMASSSKKFRKQVFDFFFSIFQGLWKTLSRSRAHVEDK